MWCGPMLQFCLWNKFSIFRVFCHILKTSSQLKIYDFWSIVHFLTFQFWFIPVLCILNWCVYMCMCVFRSLNSLLCHYARSTVDNYTSKVAKMPITVVCSCPTLTSSSLNIKPVSGTLNLTLRFILCLSVTTFTKTVDNISCS